MYIQWCIKGIAGQDPAQGLSDGLDDAAARDVVDSKTGILCNWWRAQGTISPSQIRDKLAAVNLDLHINNYAAIKNDTPFISLAAGCVERDVFYRTNRVYPADRVALGFATDWGNRPGYLYFLWTIVSLKVSVAIEQVAEEVRSLNVYQSWSPYQLEGEVTAKIYIPSVQIERVQKWEPAPPVPGMVRAAWRTPHANPTFEQPDVISNVRTAF
jgi:hypothetical protein